MTLSSEVDVRAARARLSLAGLSIGDAFGERFFEACALEHLASKVPPPAPWAYTDDTEMATAITDVLVACGGIDRERLAAAFARRYAHDRHRGYGDAAHTILQQIAEGVPWREAARSVFGGEGSLGNGGAMRSAPVGAYFADDIGKVVEHARASAEVTHAHPEGQAGAIATAVSAAFAWRARHANDSIAGTTLLSFAIDHTPPGETRKGLERARALPADSTVAIAARFLGTGNMVMSADTVPFALWCAEKNLDGFERAMWATVSGMGDRDTTCAIVGGIIALYTGLEGLPGAWLEAREPLRHDQA